MAFDQSFEDLAEFLEGIRFPVLLDAEHELAETYAITNVPTVVWIDEGGRIARPNGVAFGTDTFVEFTGIPGEPGKEAVRRWVHHGEVDVTPEEAARAVHDLTPADEEARLRFRIAARLLAEGRRESGLRHLARAGELAPHDWTVRRAGLALVGDDPFGERFFALWEEWQQAGSPYNGLPPP